MILSIEKSRAWCATSVVAWRSCIKLAAMSICGLQLVSMTFAAPGDLDSTFGVAGVAFAGETDVGYPTTFQGREDGVSVVAYGCLVGTGEPLGSTNEIRMCVRRLLGDGIIDTTFGLNGLAISPSISGMIDAPTQVAFMPDGRVVSAGVCGDMVNRRRHADFCIAMFLENGSPDITFGNGGVANIELSQLDDWPTALRVLPDSSLLLAGECDLVSPGYGTYSCIVKITPTGQLDHLFGVHGVVRTSAGIRAKDFVMQTSGKFVLGGTCTGTQTVGRLCAVRFSPDGVEDLSFASAISLPSGAAISTGGSIGLDENDQIVIGGLCYTANSVRLCALRLGMDGVVDATFGDNGLFVDSAAMDSFSYFGKIARSSTWQGTRWFLYAKCSPPNKLCLIAVRSNGALDNSFGDNGRAIAAFSSISFPGDFAVVKEGRPVISSSVCPLPTNPNFCLARFKSGPYDATTCALNADANNQVAGNDATLAVRYLLGYTGNALTDGALGANPGRTAEQIEAYLAQLKTEGKLDVDGDGESLAITDGVLILRAMLGLSGDALTQGALGKPSAAFPTLRTSQQILQWIESTHGVACLP